MKGVGKEEVEATEEARAAVKEEEGDPGPRQFNRNAYE